MAKAGVCVGVMALLLSGCQIGAGETRHDHTSIERDKVEMARVAIQMGAGELRVKGGTPKLLEADFAYDADWKPVVEYRTGPTGGDLTISQPKNSTSLFGGNVHTWDLKLNGQLPLDLTASLGAGEAHLELGQMNLRTVDVNIGAGEVTVDLRGEPRHDYKVQIHGGVGEATVYLPRDAGVSATAAGGIGEISTTGLEQRNGVWINPERVRAPVTVHLDVQGGVGEIRLIR